MHLTTGSELDTTHMTKIACTEVDDPYDDWRSNPPPGLPAWANQKQNEHPCVMCGKRTLIYNLGRCRPCETKFLGRDSVVESRTR